MNKLLDEMLKAQRDLQARVSEQQATLAATMDELNAVNRAIKAYQQGSSVPAPKRIRRPRLMLAGPAPEPAASVPAPETKPEVKVKGLRGSKRKPRGLACLTPEQRREAGRKGAAARWAKVRAAEQATSAA